MAGFVNVREKKYKTLSFEHNNEGVAKITFRREESLNAISTSMIVELIEVMDIFSKEPHLKVLILTGKGRGFCTGADLKNTLGAVKKGTIASVGEVMMELKKVIMQLCTTEKIVICQLNGVAAGAGFSFAMACDIRISGESGSLVASFIKRALLPDCGLTYTLPKVVGAARALEICLLGETINSKKGLELGILNKVVPDDQLETEVLSLATRLAKGPVQSYGCIKSMIYSNESLSEKFDTETKQQMKAFQRPEFFDLLAKFNKKSKL